MLIYKTATLVKNTKKNNIYLTKLQLCMQLNHKPYIPGTYRFWKKRPPPIQVIADKSTCIYKKISNFTPQILGLL